MTERKGILINVVFILLLSPLFLTGCMNKQNINADFRKMDQSWRTENEKIVKKLQYRIVSTDKKAAFQLVKKTFTDLGMTIVNSSLEGGYIITKNEAPTPLSQQQWETVREIENPKLNELVGWMYSLEKVPSDYFVIVKASIIENKSSDSEIRLKVSLEMPKYVSMGLVPSKEIPPHALALATEKMWSQLEKNIASVATD